MKDRAFLRKKLTSSSSNTYLDLINDNGLKSTQLLRRDGFLMTPEGQSQQRKVTIKKIRNKTAEGGNKAPTMVNKTLRKDIFDPIVMRRDFNNVEMIGD